MSSSSPTTSLVISVARRASFLWALAVDLQFIRQRRRPPNAPLCVLVLYPRQYPHAILGVVSVQLKDLVVARLHPIIEPIAVLLWLPPVRGQIPRVDDATGVRHVAPTPPLGLARFVCPNLDRA